MTSIAIAVAGYLGFLAVVLAVLTASKRDDEAMARQRPGEPDGPVA